MWVLALAGVFLAVAKACIFCRLPTHALPSRLARLSSQMEMQWKEWASPDFSAFALDEVTMNKITEKTHRVLKVMEIKRSFSSLPSYWQWLQKTKIPQYTREATPLGPSFQLSVLPPAVSQKGGSTILYNCSTCEGKEASCWPRKRCFPGSYDLRDAKILLLSISGIVLLLGALSLQVEYRHLQAKDL
ncbi:sperm-egg fusion protein TMEM95 isoform X1 [Peromyscus eremicus]|uniref:sperm-egg fusion protein TMEM95 isoform X1 n=1 Tax=Peromyscus eremicus TaxID=42410 RepID=UPI0027DE8398|nr:sperm-egg fusion protein TMEM95 isoform X1 [Peromyscus eremicus]